MVSGENGMSALLSQSWRLIFIPETCAAGNGGCQHNCSDTSLGTRYIDECRDNNGGCSHGCVNTDGGFECVCPKGFKVRPKQRVCVDIDECDLNTTCDHTCVNTAGSFYCTCKAGYQLYGATHCAAWNQCLPFPKPPKSPYLVPDIVQERKYVPCRVTPIHTPSIPHSKFTYFCGDNTRYKWSYEKLNQTLPFCSSQVLPPTAKRKARFVFVAAKCRKKRRLREDIRKNLTIQLNGQKMYKCRRMCLVTNVNFECKKIPKKFRRLARKSRGEVVVAEVEIQIASRGVRQKCDVDCTRKRTERRLKKVLKKLKKVINKKQLYLRYDRQNIQVAKKSLKAKKLTSMKCQDGQVLVDSRCLSCSIGTYFKRRENTCLPCPPGTYQDKEGQISCIGCPNKVPGAGIVGAANVTECSITCAPGNFYDIKKHVCVECPTGTYQAKPGQNHCVKCPGTTITDGPGAANQSMCKDTSCGGIIGDLQGFIQSPNYPGHYPNNRECVWKIKPGKKRRILVIIPEVFLPKEDKCGDILVFRKSKKPSSLTTYETCETREKPIAFTSRSRRMWIQFKTDSKNTAKEDYQRLIEDIVRDGRLYSSYQHQSILKDRKLLSILMEVIAQPYNYFNYANVSRTMMPESFINLLTSKVTGFFST
ncbi:hypothetical protein FSP39_011233 [Pinctada imbricata]|uniref:Signal peptide, CUB and EGF-like domain-containing protein 1 n=1 Tax=Pinctada imbricata TaxID=66713 RepID=A0AA88YNP6_PINIB|nr:hypothetical protein FSP39_011233 [Pinctada imbricata]